MSVPLEGLVVYGLDDLAEDNRDCHDQLYFTLDAKIGSRW
jgi:hypothetical protein